MSITKPWRYIIDHWQGRLGFAVSFWINLVTLRIVIFLAQEALSPAEGRDYSAFRWEVLGLAVFFHGIVFIWQIAGSVRASETHLKQGGAIAHVWGAHLGALIAFWLTVTYAFACWQMTLVIPDNIKYSERLERDRAARYRIELLEDKATLALSGTIEPGITRKFKSWLKQSPQIRTVTLNSGGGNIYEARGLSKLIRDKGLATRVEIECSSSCTTVFIGGKTRTLKKGARLGFHQYRVDANYEIPFSNPAGEQARDRALFAAAGVKPWFLDKMHTSSAIDMWFPSAEELVRTGIVTDFIPE